MADQAFDATKAFGHREPAQLFAQGVGLLLRGLEAHGHDCTSSVHLLLGNVVLGMIGPVGVTHPVHGGVIGQLIGEGSCIGHLLTHAQRQGLDAAGDQPAVEGGGL